MSLRSSGEKWNGLTRFEKRKWLYMRSMNLEIGEMSWEEIKEWDEGVYGHLIIANVASDRKWFICNERIVSRREYNRRLGREIPEDIEKVEEN